MPADQGGQPGGAAPAPVAGGAGGQAGRDPNAVAVPGLVFDVDESTFTSLVAISDRVPVVDLWAGMVRTCNRLSPVSNACHLLGDARAGGSTSMRTRLQRAFGVSRPTVVALIRASPCTVPERSARTTGQAYFDELLKLAGGDSVTSYQPSGYEPGKDPAH